MSDAERIYLTEREAEARAAAAAAGHPGARSVHLAMAEAYRQRLEGSAEDAGDGDRDDG